MPGDIWDFDSVQHLILADLRSSRRPRKVIMQANKNGFYYVLDRATGELVSAAPFARVTWASGIDPRTRRPVVNEEAYYGTEPTPISPGPGGAHSWAPMSYHPGTGLTYVPTTTASSFSYAAEPVLDVRPERMTGIVRPAPAPRLPPPPAIGPPPVDSPANRGALVAWDPIRQEIRWRMPGSGALGGGTVATAGNLVFQTLNNGRLMAYSADAGEKLLEIDTGLRSGMGPPITYRVDGRQFVAVMGGTGTTVPGGVRPKLMTFSLALAPRYAIPRSVAR